MAGTRHGLQKSRNLLLGVLLLGLSGNLVTIQAQEQRATAAGSRSNVKRALNPANRQWRTAAPASKSSLGVSSEVFEDQDAVRPASGHQEEAVSPVPMPDAHADSIVEQHAPASMPQSAEPLYSDPIVSSDEEGVVYDEPIQFGSGAMACDDYSCEPSLCNSPSCGPGPCLTFANPLVDTPGFVNNLLCRMQFRVQSATFWTTEANIPVLATSDTNAALPTSTAAILGGPSTVNLFGPGRVLADAKSGIRADFTLWLDPMKQRGAWVRLYNSGANRAGISLDQDDVSVLARPFNEVSSGTPTAATNLLAYPGERSGSIDIAMSGKVQGGDLLMRHRIFEDSMVRSDFLWGYQKIRFAEELAINTSSVVLPTSTSALDPGTTLTLNDRFAVANQFNGGQLGYMRSAHDGCWYFDGMFKLGFGTLNRTVVIDGSSTSTVPGPPVDTTTTQVGLLARRTNINTYEEDRFVVVPELSLNAAYLLTDQLHFTIGYTYFRLPKVTRVGDAIDENLSVNTSDPLAGSLSPAFTFKEKNLDVQTLDLGLQYQY